MKIFAMFDRKSGEFFGICTWKNSALYMRSVAPVVNDPNPQNLLHSNSADFDLYCLGDFDQKSGEITPTFEYICSAADLKTKEEVNG